MLVYANAFSFVSKFINEKCIIYIILHHTRKKRENKLHAYEMLTNSMQTAV